MGLFYETCSIAVYIKDQTLLQSNSPVYIKVPKSFTYKFL